VLGNVHLERLDQGVVCVDGVSLVQQH
jgi:hypothetical protein